MMDKELRKAAGSAVLAQAKHHPKGERGVLREICETLYPYRNDPRFKNDKRMKRLMNEFAAGLYDDEDEDDFEDDWDDAEDEWEDDEDDEWDDEDEWEDDEEEEVW